ncbi:MAG: glycosyltransferase family 4 protein [Alphaproteobacteria bacterium]|nr:glycosyltransferase family 4 protein [Alphaproteobacteria bacterium]
MPEIVHLLSGLQIGGKERAALRLARRAMLDGRGATLVLYDTPIRSAELDFDPGEVPVIHLKRGRGVDLRFAWRLSRQLRALDARVVHAHNDTALFYAALAATLALPRRVRVIASFHAWPSQGGRGARWLTRAAGMVASAAAVSDDLAGLLTRAGWLGKCGVIRNGVDIDHYTPAGPTDGWRDRLGVGGRDFLVGHIARFDPIKRHADLLEAAARLAEEGSPIVFVLVGQGPLLDEMRSRAAGLGNIRFVAQVTDMPPLLRSLDAMVLCSAHEATPLALLEGMACGVPVVATAVGGVPDLLGGAGLLVPPRDPHELARALATLAADPALRARLAKAARRRSLDFPFEAEWAAYARLYAGEAEYFSRLGRCFKMRSSRSQ